MICLMSVFMICLVSVFMIWFDACFHDLFDYCFMIHLMSCFFLCFQLFNVDHGLGSLGENYRKTSTNLDTAAKQQDQVVEQEAEQHPHDSPSTC